MGSRSAIQISSDAISLVSDAGKLIYASPASAQLLGYSQNELRERNTLDLIHPEDHGRSRRALLSVIAKPATTRHVDVRVRRKDGGWCWMESAISNLLDEPRIGAIVVNCRETARAEEREWHRRQIVELTNRNELLEDCAHAVAHDFREPLRTISLFTQLLLEREELQAETKRLARQILDGARRMDALFEELHAAAVRGTDDDSGPPVDLNQSVAAALQVLRHALVASGAIVTVDPLPCVLGNESNLLRVFQNLIGNAIKYRSAKQIRIHVSAARVGTQWIVKVDDNGMGIAAEFRRLIFLPRKRLHGLEIPGAGIGLAICKRVIGGMGGEIWVESEFGAGSTFCFSLPAGKEAKGECASPGDDPQVRNAPSHWRGIES